MKYGAYAEICGYLGDDLRICKNENQKSYGVLSIAVNKVSRLKKLKATEAKTDWFKLHIKNITIIDKYKTLLKKGNKIWAKGDLRSVYVKGLLGEGVFETYINVTKKSDISVLDWKIDLNCSKEQPIAKGLTSAALAA